MQRAQGAIEYLLIIGAAILIVAIVILATSGVLSGGQSQVSVSQGSETISVQGLQDAKDLAQGISTERSNIGPGETQDVNLTLVPKTGNFADAFNGLPLGTTLVINSKSYTMTTSGWNPSLPADLTIGTTITVTAPSTSTVQIVQKGTSSSNSNSAVTAQSACGSDNNSEVSFPPSTGACSSGTASQIVTTSTKYDWNCSSQTNTVACFATRHVASGSLADPKVITSPRDLQDMNINADMNYLLSSNIDIYAATHSGGELWNNGAGFIPIPELKGQFDGGSHTISGIMINSSGGNAALFAHASAGSSIKNLTLSNFDVTSGGFYAAPLLAYGTANISNVHVLNTSVKSTFGGNSLAGGLVGSLDNGSIQKSSSSGNILVASSIAGGIASVIWNGTTISETKSSVSISVAGSDCDDLGGIVGYMGRGASISDSYATGKIDGANGCTGDCRNVGGLVGITYDLVNISNSYSTGAVFAKDSRYGGVPLGGLIGNGSALISNSFSAGQVSYSGPNTGSVGGLIGSSSGTISNSFWDKNSSDINVMCGSGIGCNDLNGMTQAYFYSSSNQPMASWDFANKWATVAGAYPKLKWETQ
ncbi:MAG: GLUG motif-containing protein [archaeon]